MGEQKKKRFHMPHAYTLIFLLIVLVAVLTWIIPSGEFQRTMVETSTGEREVVVAGTYHGVSKIAEDGTNLRQGIQAVLTAPALGIQNAIEVLAVCRISFSQWWKTIWKVFVVLTIIALVFCAISAGM